MFGKNNTPQLSSGSEISRVVVDFHPGTNEPAFDFEPGEDDVEEIDFAEGGVVVRYSSDEDSLWVPLNLVRKVHIDEGSGDQGGMF